jgi:hypothetical protein
MPKERAVRVQQVVQVDKDGKCIPAPMMCKEGKGVRNFSCPNYDNCLDKAAKGMWSGFTCKECGLNGQKEEEKT